MKLNVYIGVYRVAFVKKTSDTLIGLVHIYLRV